MTKLNFLLMSFALFFSGCAATSSVTLPSEYTSGANKVIATKTHANILLLAPMSNAEAVIEDLASQCSSGRVKNVTTSFSTRFFYLFLLEKVQATGECID